MKHTWQTVNREVHEPSDISLLDVVEEIKAALVDREDLVTALVEYVDRGRYTDAGKIIAIALALPPRT